MRVAEIGGTCDGVLHLSLQGEAVAEDYVCLLGKACGHCFTGARVSGELILSRSDRTPWAHTFSDSIAPPSAISHCPKDPRGAPLDWLWPKAVLDGLRDLWGTPVLSVALDDLDENLRMGAVRVLETPGQEEYTLLVKALKDQSPEIRSRAANALGSQGSQARDLVPGLIEALDDDDRPVRMAVAGALHNITGQDFGENQDAWRKWLKEPRLTPTPFTTWKGVPIMPGAISIKELTGLLTYVVQAGCGEVSAFYQAEAARAGWTFVESESSPNPRRQFNLEKGRETASVYLYDTPVTTGKSRCTVQIIPQ